MGLETGTTFQDLDATYPLNEDVRRDGAAHLRLIKDVLQKNWPGEGGFGLSKVIVATEDELNSLSGVTSAIQPQIDTLTDAISDIPGILYAPAGTKMMFHQKTAPDGWTIDPNHDGRMVVTANQYAGESAGKHAPTEWTHAHGTQGHTLNVTEIPSHTHHLQTRNTTPAGTITWDDQNVQQQFVQPEQAQWDNGDTQPSGGGGAHAHGNTLSVDWEPFVTFVTICTKDA